MDSRRFATVAASGMAVLALSAILGAQATPAKRTVLDGVYTDAQADRGQVEYDAFCQRCHGVNLEGGGQAPSLIAERFVDAWREDFLSSLYEHTATRMPRPPVANPGTLKENQYVDVIAFLLAMNEYPAGPRELTRSDMDATLFIARVGPQPLPANATVRAVGCLTPDKDNWTLTRATDPTRVRNAVEIDERELAQSAKAGPGARVYRLANLDEQMKAPELATHVAEKVQVKGVLSGDSANARIYTLSFTPLGPKCTS